MEALITLQLTLLSSTCAVAMDQAPFPSLLGAPNSHAFETTPHPVQCFHM
jgi:hypothetical protein